MSSVQAYKAIDETLLLLSAAAQAAHRGVRDAAAEGAHRHLVELLERFDRELVALHKRLLDESLGRSEPAEKQLALEAA